MRALSASFDEENATGVVFQVRFKWRNSMYREVKGLFRGGERAQGATVEAENAPIGPICGQARSIWQESPRGIRASA